MAMFSHFCGTGKINLFKVNGEKQKSVKLQY